MNDVAKRGRWQPGQSGNPAGRPRGSGHVIDEELKRAFAADVHKHGASVIERVRKNEPAKYLALASPLCQKTCR